jgi:hypothetical protein
MRYFILTTTAAAIFTIASVPQIAEASHGNWRAVARSYQRSYNRVQRDVHRSHHRYSARNYQQPHYRSSNPNFYSPGYHRNYGYSGGYGSIYVGSPRGGFYYSF